MIPKTETTGDDAAEEWSTPVNWEEDPAIKAKRRRKLYITKHFSFLKPNQIFHYLNYHHKQNYAKTCIT